MNRTNQPIDIPAEAWEMARKPYHITVRRDDEDGYYVAEVAEFPYLSGAENTPEEAIATLRDALALTIATQMRRGVPIPDPQPIHA